MLAAAYQVDPNRRMLTVAVFFMAIKCRIDTALEAILIGTDIVILAFRLPLPEIAIPPP
jgi:hypothetical protein